MGHLVFLRWEGAGAGLGTSLAYWVLLVIAVLILCKHPKVAPFQLWKLQPYDFQGMKEVLRLGLPIGGIVFAEVIIFSLVGLLMAKFPSLTIASHQSAMNFSTLMYAFQLVSPVPWRLSYLTNWEQEDQKWSNNIAVWDD